MAGINGGMIGHANAGKASGMFTMDELPLGGGVSNVIFEYLLVGGGGGGGTGAGTGYPGGGGGAGEVAQGTLIPTPRVLFQVVIGSGGAVNTKGNDSKLDMTVPIIAMGGGKGGAGTGVAGGDGASGGGGGKPSGAHGKGTTGKGHDGGDAQAGTGGGYSGAGGGAKTAASSLSAGAGITSTFTGVSVLYGQGGSSCDHTGSGVGARQYPDNTGSGGGGHITGAAGLGSSGFCAIRYESPTPLATGGTVTTFTDGGKTYQLHSYTASGQFTLN